MKKAIIIDDDKLTLKILELVLSSKQFEVDAYVDINQMEIDDLEMEPADLFIIDYNISGFNGIEIGENLKEICPNAKFIAISSTDKEKIVNLHEEFDKIFDRFIHKPFTTQVFQDALDF
jgi:two-component SAPR family response regulator